MHRSREERTFMTRSRAGIVAGVALVSLGLAACSSSGGSGGSSSGDIQVGATNVLSGAIASVCKPITDGAHAWFDSVNAKGGINGHKIDYTVLDDAYDPARAASNARKLVSDKNVALVAGCGTANEQAAYTITSKSGVPLIGPYADLSSYLSPASDNYFGLFPAYGDQDAAAIEAGVAKLGTGSVLHIAQNSAGVSTEDAAAQAGAKKAGAQWLGNQLVDPTTTDYTPLALTVKTKHPDFILISAGDAQAAQIILALKSQGVVPNKAYLLTFASTSTLLSTAGSALDGKAISVASPKLNGSDLDSCMNAIKEYASAADANVHGAYGCSVAQVVTAALQKVHGDITSKSLAAALNTLNADSSAPAFGPITFSPTNHAGVTTGTIYTVSGGAFVAQGSTPYGGQ
jgi:ABC-type branched-subunit amino acid transport system substrate-binding protein